MAHGPRNEIARVTQDNVQADEYVDDSYSRFKSYENEEGVVWA